MKNKVILFLMIILSFVIQCTICPIFSLGNITPNILVIMVISIGLMRGCNTAMIVGFLTGILWDLFFGKYLGTYGLIFMVVGYFSGLSNGVYFDNNVKVPMVLAAGGDFLYNVGVFIMTFLFRGKLNITYYFTRIMIPELIYTIFVTAIIYRIFYLINHKFMEEERKERDTLWLTR